MRPSDQGKSQLLHFESEFNFLLAFNSKHIDRRDQKSLCSAPNVALKENDSAVLANVWS